MESTIFLLLGALDFFLVQMITFKIFRFPVSDYIKEIMLFSITISLTSYIFRITLNVPSIDTIVQLALYILFLRYVVRVNFIRSSIMSGIGLLAFIAIRLLVFQLFVIAGLLDANNSGDSEGSSIYTMQIISDLLILLVSFMIYRFNLGFSLFPVPPHDMFMKAKHCRNFLLLILLIMSIFSSILYLSIYHHLIMAALPLVLLIFATIIYIMYRKELSN